MRRWRETYKPAAPARFHLLLAASLWTTVGAVLLLVGTHWVLSGQMPHAPLWLALAVAGGLLKARFVLRRATRRIITRIRARGDGYCIGGFLSLQTWLLVAVMAIGGRLLRGGLVPIHMVGLVYVLIGCGLLVATGQLWRAWATNENGG